MGLMGGDEQTVVSMMTRGNDRRTAPLREVEAYWHALCGADSIPLRSQIDPRGIEGALENAFLAERIAPGLAKLRVAGSHLSDLMGMEVAGMPLSAFFTPADRDRLFEAVTKLFAEPAILRLHLAGESGFGKPAMQGQLLLLPLRSDMGDITRALGCLVTQGMRGRTPRRFGISGIEVSPALRQIDGLPTIGTYPAPERTQASRHMAETPKPFDHGTQRPSGKAKVPHLRVVVSNDT